MKLRPHLPVAICALLLPCTAVQAENSSACLQLFYMKQYSRALPACTRAAEEGNMQAQYALGLIYSDGLGTRKDKKLALKWLRAAADQSYAAAHYKLDKLEHEAEQPDLSQIIKKEPGVFTTARSTQHTGAPPQPNHDSNPYRSFYTEQPPVPPTTADTTSATPAQNSKPTVTDRERLMQYLTAAKHGDAHATFMLGLYYLEGRAIAQNSEEGAKQISKAAKMGDLQAQYTIGLIYLRGYPGIKADTMRALPWLTRAAEKGHRQAQYCLGLIYMDENRGMHNMRKAVTWFNKAANQRHAKAQHNLGVIYLKGISGIKPNPKKAIQRFIEEAEQGDPQAQFNLGRLYSEGKWLKARGDDAVSWFYRAGETWLSKHQPNRSRLAIKEIRALADNHVAASNLFLADVLEQKIREIP